MKLNREQIIKALELHSQGAVACLHECPYGDLHNCGSAMARDTLALIKELTEENERLEENLIKQSTENIMLLIERQEAKADTVRKMQKRIGEHFVEHNEIKYGGGLIHKIIDQIAKEMLEGIENV